MNINKSSIDNSDYFDSIFRENIQSLINRTKELKVYRISGKGILNRVDYDYYSTSGDNSGDDRYICYML